jgi:hypothetical protein
LVENNPSIAMEPHDDVTLPRYLRPYGIYPYPTQDRYGGERFMPFNPGTHYILRFADDVSGTDWYTKYSINVKEGLDHCATYSIGFHYMDSQETVRIHALLHGLCTDQR